MSGNEKNVPKRRFKEFQNDEAWEHRKFSELFTTLQNNALSRAELNSEQGMAMNVHYGDVLIKFGERLDVSKEEIPFIIDDTCVSKYKSSFLKNGDVIIADAAEDETVGKCSEIVGLTTQTVISGLHTIPCRPVQVFASGYLGFYMNSNAYHNQLLPLIQGTKVSSISKSALNDTVLIYPKSNEEQTLIAKYFTSLDNLITLHQRKLEKMKALKKAYLTDVFPAEGERKPKLRFAGFTDDWEQRKFSDIFNLSQGLQIEISKRFVNPGKNMYFYITNEFLKSDSNEMYYIYNPPVSVICDESDILMTRTGNTGVVVTDVKGCFHNNFFKIKYDPNNYDKYFICQYLSTPNMQKKILNSAGSSTIPDLSHKSFYRLLGNFPDIIEQKRISDFLISLDNLINFHQHKLEKLQNIKKAYLNEMFI